jgi:hypothetical protein
MINLRYHIVSITAVFLALGIGVALGSTLIERATVDTLNDRLDEQSERLDRTDGENADLRRELERLAEREQQLTAQGVALYAGHLAEVPTVLITTQGTDDELVAITQRSLRAADAQLFGTLRLTSRWESLSQEEVADLATLLDRALVRGPQTREAALEALSEELLAAASPAPEQPDTEEEPAVDPDGSVDPLDPVDPNTTTTTAPETSVADEPVATPILDGLIERGYIEFLADGSNVPLPSFGARYVLVVDESTEVGVEDVVVPFVELMADDDPAPMVVAEPLASVEEGAEVVEPPLAGPVVTAIRSDESLASSISGVDSAGDFIGQSAMVLALADLVGDDTQVGQYGIGVGATLLMPAIEE